MNISTKLTILLMALLLVVVGISSTTFYFSEKNILINDIYLRQNLALDALREVCTGDPSFPSSVASRYFAKFFKTQPALETICYNGEGRITYHNNPARIGEMIPAKIWQMSKPGSSDASWRVMVSPYYNKILIGVLPIPEDRFAAIIFSDSAINFQIDATLKQALTRIYMVSSVAFIAGCSLILFLSRLITRPVMALTRGARALAAGKLEYRIDIRGKDEMAILAAEFNDMSCKLSELDNMKKDFISSATHDLRSPVTGIKLCSDIIFNNLRDGKYDDIYEPVAMIAEHTARLERYINTLLEMSKIESGKLTLNARPVNLEELTAEITRSYENLAREKKLNLDFVVESYIELIMSDADKIDHILHNILNNALKYTERGSVVVKIRQEEDFQVISIKDSGKGISEDDLEHIFEKYYRSKDKSRFGIQGTGLGLFTARAYAEFLGGKITVESRPRVGSEFSIYIPVKKVA